LHTVHKHVWRVVGMQDSQSSADGTR